MVKVWWCGAVGEKKLQNTPEKRERERYACKQANIKHFVQRIYFCYYYDDDCFYNVTITIT